MHEDGCLSMDVVGNLQGTTVDTFDNGLSIRNNRKFDRVIECSVDVENVDIEIVTYSPIMANVGNTHWV